MWIPSRTILDTGFRVSRPMCGILEFLEMWCCWSLSGRPYSLEIAELHTEYGSRAPSRLLAARRFPPSIRARRTPVEDAIHNPVLVIVCYAAVAA